MPAFLAEGFLETPTAFGVPLGALLLFLWAMRAINDSRQQSRPTAPATGQSPRPEPASPTVPRFRRAPTHRFRPSTEAIPLAGEVDSSVVLWMPNWLASWAVVRSPLAAAKATLASNTAPNARRFPAIILLLIGCLRPGKIHLISAP